MDDDLLRHPHSLQELTGELVHQDGLLEVFLTALNDLLASAAGEAPELHGGLRTTWSRRRSQHPPKPVNISHPCIGGDASPQCHWAIKARWSTCKW